jgi:hypothetical protein
VKPHLSRLTRFSLDVRYEDDFGVNAGLKVQALNAGLEIGGNFEDHQSMVWRMKGSFADAHSTDKAEV